MVQTSDKWEIRSPVSFKGIFDNYATLSGGLAPLPSDYRPIPTGYSSVKIKYQFSPYLPQEVPNDFTVKTTVRCYEGEHPGELGPFKRIIHRDFVWSSAQSVSDENEGCFVAEFSPEYFDCELPDAPPPPSDPCLAPC